MNKRIPTVSVVMPSYNTPVEMLSQAVESVLNQTFTDFEFIIIDDCSTDRSLEYLRSLKDERIKIITNERNLGITASLNVGFRAAQGRYIARMDSDDISLPDRFQKQLAFMQTHPEVIVCGSWIQAFGNASYCAKRVIPQREYLQCSFLFGNAFGLSHPTAFFRAELLRKNSITYDEDLPTAQDYGMWSVCAEYGDIANVEDILLKYRVHNGQISVTKRALQQKCAMHVQKKLLSRLFDIVDDELRQKHFDICTTKEVTREMFSWIRLLEKANEQKRVFERAVFQKVSCDFLKTKIKNKAMIAVGLKDVALLFKACPVKYHGVIWKTLFGRVQKKIKQS